jgi:hypothetical protein
VPLLNSKYNIKDDSNIPALDIGNPVVVDLSGVDMTFAIFLLVLSMYFVTTHTICSYDRGNDYRLIDLYINQRLN